MHLNRKNISWPALTISALALFFLAATLLTPNTSAQKIKPALDRKSTRLNSSHVSISYAVFCLKKKKTNDKNIIKIIQNHYIYIESSHHTLHLHSFPTRRSSDLQTGGMRSW